MISESNLIEVFSLHKINHTEYFQKVYEHIQDGIVVMRESREIIMLNPAAKRLTGWKVGDYVPYCSFCTTRNRRVETPSCYLMANEDVPSILSQMSTNRKKTLDVEMSVSVINRNVETGENEYLLILRDCETMLKAQEAALNKKMIQALIDAKESEHKRLAQELHDGVGQSLYSVSVALEAIEAYMQDNEKLSSYVKEVRNELRKVIEDVYTYSYNLRPQSLDQLGLKAALENLIDNMKKMTPHLIFELTTQGLDRCDPAIEINLYRIAQEALHNVVKYAQASYVKISIRKNNTHIHMKIEDDGIGFDRKSIQNKGLGLKHIEERVDLLSGTCAIRSEMNKGTVVEVTIPRWRPNT